MNPTARQTKNYTRGTREEVTLHRRAVFSMGVGDSHAASVTDPDRASRAGEGMKAKGLSSDPDEVFS